MSKQPAAPLTPGIMAKGLAVPSPATASGLATITRGPSTAGNASTQVAKSTNTYYKSLTLKLDERRYKALKAAGVDLDKSSQDILVEALDAWLASKK